VPGMRLVEVSDLRSALLLLNDSVSTPRPGNVVPIDVAR